MGEGSQQLRGAPAAEVAGALSLDALSALCEELGPEAWRARSDAAQVVASYLSCHPRVEAVRYPGLRSDPLFGAASTTLRRGFGPRVALRVDGEWRLWEAGAHEAAEQVMELERALPRP